MIEQFIYFLGSLLVLSSAPILIYLGQKVKREIPQLPEATSDLTGQIGQNEPTLNVLCLGESTMAGVGITSHNQGIAGALAQTIFEHNHQTVHWQVLAKSGFSAKAVGQQLVHLIPPKPFELVVIGLGGNDTFELNAPLTFRKNMIILIKKLQNIQPNALIIIVNLPPVGQFPAFPFLLQWVLGGLVKLHARVIKDVPQEFQNVLYMNKPIVFSDWLERAGGQYTIHDFFSDGIHPAALTYQLWGQEIGNFVIESGRLG